MLHRGFPDGIRFHVYTEPDRDVPSHMIKHPLDIWKGIGGPRRSWWYKMQLFNPEHHRGNLLYLDLDVVIVRSLDWIRNHNPGQFWSLRDFKYLQRPQMSVINSSMMWWNVEKFSSVWQEFAKTNIHEIVKRYPGDQDYLSRAIDRSQQRFFQDQYFQSFRWQCLDGGFDFKSRKVRTPGSGVDIAGDTSVVVFHGLPKPHSVTDPVIAQLWG
jgi:hypothetical protein